MKFSSYRGVKYHFWKVSLTFTILHQKVPLYELQFNETSANSIIVNKKKVQKAPSPRKDLRRRYLIISLLSTFKIYEKSRKTPVHTLVNYIPRDVIVLPHEFLARGVAEALSPPPIGAHSAYLLSLVNLHFIDHPFYWHKMTLLCRGWHRVDTGIVRGVQHTRIDRWVGAGWRIAGEHTRIPLSTLSTPHPAPLYI